LDAYQVEQLKPLLVHAGANVPFYRDLFRDLGFDPRAFRRLRDLEALPPIDKATVRADPDRFLAENVPPRARRYLSTSGTTGVPLGVWNVSDSSARERAFIYSIWSRAGVGPRSRRAILRGVPIPQPPHWRYDLEERAHIYSNIYLSSETASEFASAMTRNGNTVLHSYPSSLSLFARYAEDQQLSVPRFDAILTSSEQLFPAQKEHLQSFYDCRLFEWYGHSEKVVLAAQCEHSDLFHVVPEYGFAELLDADGELVGAGEAGEIAGTTFNNYAMPLIRYRTGDWATRSEQGACRCGRPHDLWAEIIGRRETNFVVTKDGSLLSLLAVDPYTDSFDRVVRMQFVQERPGELELRLVTTPGFTDADASEIAASVSDLLGDLVDLSITLCEDIPLTPNGKHVMLVQKLRVPSATTPL
jgi:phenylacetate-CoA ligase